MFFFRFWKHEVIIEIELKRIIQMDRTNLFVETLHYKPRYRDKGAVVE